MKGILNKIGNKAENTIQSLGSVIDTNISKHKPGLRLAVNIIMALLVTLVLLFEIKVAGFMFGISSAIIHCAYIVAAVVLTIYCLLTLLFAIKEMLKPETGCSFTQLHFKGFIIFSILVVISIIIYAIMIIDAFVQFILHF